MPTAVSRINIQYNLLVYSCQGIPLLQHIGCPAPNDAAQYLFDLGAARCFIFGIANEEVAIPTTLEWLEAVSLHFTWKER